MLNVIVGSGTATKTRFVAWYGGGDIVCELWACPKDAPQRHAKVAAFDIDAANVTIGELLGRLALVDANEFARNFAQPCNNRERGEHPFAALIAALASDTTLQAASPAWYAEEILRAAL